MAMALVLDLYSAPLYAECSYYDARECRKRAAQLAGVCAANPDELKLQPGVGKYCLVQSSRVSMCNYADRTSCDNEAVRQGAVCVEFPSGGVQPNPYRLDPNSKY
jgi:hypothetical protein